MPARKKLAKKAPKTKIRYVTAPRRKRRAPAKPYGKTPICLEGYKITKAGRCVKDKKYQTIVASIPMAPPHPRAAVSYRGPPPPPPRPMLGGGYLRPKPKSKTMTVQQRIAMLNAKGRGGYRAPLPLRQSNTVTFGFPGGIIPQRPRPFGYKPFVVVPRGATGIPRAFTKKPTFPGFPAFGPPPPPPPKSPRAPPVPPNSRVPPQLYPMAPFPAGNILSVSVSKAPKPKSKSFRGVKNMGYI